MIYFFASQVDAVVTTNMCEPLNREKHQPLSAYEISGIV